VLLLLMYPRSQILLYAANVRVNLPSIMIA
jgi:hypothetical protein